LKDLFLFISCLVHMLLSVAIAVGVIILVALIVKLSLKPKESKSSTSIDQEASKKVESTKPTEVCINKGE